VTINNDTGPIGSCNWNENNLNTLTRNNWRASLVNFFFYISSLFADARDSGAIECNVLWLCLLVEYSNLKSSGWIPARQPGSGKPKHEKCMVIPSRATREWFLDSLCRARKGVGYSHFIWGSLRDVPFPCENMLSTGAPIFCKGWKGAKFFILASDLKKASSRGNSSSNSVY
jgi:hypothetical protein